MNKLMFTSCCKQFINANGRLSLFKDCKVFYSKDILRGRYEKKKTSDGKYIEFNETVTVIPKEFEEQDEYRGEKRLTKAYTERYARRAAEKLRRVSIQQPEDQTDNNGTCKHTELTQKSDDDMPVTNMEDPYKKDILQCIFCKYDIPLDYKNAQLLSQFVSPQTGLLYRQEVTGLCHFKYKELESTVKKCRAAGLMPYYYKEKVFINDPGLFDPFRDNLKKIPDNYDKRNLE